MPDSVSYGNYFTYFFTYLYIKKQLTYLPWSGVFKHTTFQTSFPVNGSIVVSSILHTQDRPS